ncbi:MAG TPA: hypothetical protein VFT39_20705 [Vicinamibacterales bacterium]|nr:hypothetical protein [Vicinamibacterales bacterium]
MHRNRLPSAVFAIAAAAVVALVAADPPYMGKWKMNPAKSDFGETTVTYEQLPSGEMQATMAGASYKFKLDGKEVPATFGTTATWKTLSANKWETTWKLNGKTLTTDTLTLSPDGKAMTVNSKGKKPNGEMLDDTVVAERVSGSSGLAGKWRTKNVKSAAPSVLEIAASGADGVVFKIVDMDLTCNGKFDGKDHPCSGPTLGPGWTASFANAGPRALDMSIKNNGKEFFKLSYSVSADGKTLTESGTATGPNEKTKVVYDKQ